MYEAIMKFERNPMIISSETLDIGDIPPPLLLICSANQYSIEKVCVSAIQSGIMPAHCNYLSIPSNLLKITCQPNEGCAHKYM